MKNKKLFAILTLVCFMFTLMPMAAFADTTNYAAVVEDYEVIAVGGKTQIEVAEQIHISQAQVSRLEKNALKSMRTYLT